MTLKEALHALGSMSEVHVEHINYVPNERFGAAIYGRTDTSYMVVEGYSVPWTLELESSEEITVTRVTRMTGATPYPGTSEAPPAPSMSISMPADAWEVLVVEFETDGESYECPADLDGDGQSDLADVTLFVDCMSGPGHPLAPGCEPPDLDGDDDADAADFAIFQAAFGCQ